VSSPAPSRDRDGRTARAERTRAAIVDAHIALLAEGAHRPTGEQITGRAGVSVRSLWVHFTDLEALFAATAAEILSRQEADVRPVDPHLPLRERVERFCRQRAEALERIAPLARASALHEPTSPSLRDYHRRHLDLVRAEAVALFAPELRPLPGADRVALLDALVAATTWGAWSTLRDHLGRSRDDARAAMTGAVRALLDRPTTTTATPR
jgi:TetR/AcrR family transcriptional regulator, regulator of autoinduction and epiphytic fitness